MEIRVPRYLLTVFIEDSVTRAAGFLHITQPMPSRQLVCALAWKRQQPLGIAAEKFINHVKECLLKQE